MARRHSPSHSTSPEKYPRGTFSRPLHLSQDWTGSCGCMIFKTPALQLVWARVRPSCRSSSTRMTPRSSMRILRQRLPEWPHWLQAWCSNGDIAGQEQGYAYSPQDARQLNDGGRCWSSEASTQVRRLFRNVSNAARNEDPRRSLVWWWCDAALTSRLAGR